MNQTKDKSSVRNKKGYNSWIIVSVFNILVILIAVLAIYELKSTSDELSIKIDIQAETIEQLKVENEELTSQNENSLLLISEVNAEINGLKETNKKLLENNKKLSEDNARLLKRIDSLREQARQLNIKAKKVAKPVPTVSRGTSTPKGKTIQVEATAYTAYCAGCSGTTATGIDLRANSSLKVIAVDPKIIPLGSKVYVEGYGHAIAGDTGGAIKGNKIDIFMANKSDAYKWGRQTITITIL